MVATVIKKYLDDHGIKYSYLSEKIGVPMNVLSPMLNDKRQMPIEVYKKICLVLEVPFDMFLKEQIKQKTDRSAFPTSFLPNLFTLCILQAFATSECAKCFYEILCHFRSFGSATCLIADKVYGVLDIVSADNGLLNTDVFT